MTERKDWDTPAMLIAGALGVLVVAASLPFTVIAYCRQEGCGDAPAEPKAYDITWGEVQVGPEVRAAAADANPTGEAVVSLRDTLPATATITVGTSQCVDEYDPDLRQEPATFNYTLAWRSATGEMTPLATGSFTCGGLEDDLVVTQALGPHPDVATVRANSTEEATAQAWSQATNSTGDVVLRLTASRPASAIPLPGNLPVGQTRMGATATLEVTQWGLAANEQPAEVLR